MSPEDRIKIYGDTPQARVMNFIDALNKDGYVMTNFSKIRELTDIIAKGGKEPLKNYQSLKELEARMVDEEELTSKFRFGLRDSLNIITNIIKNDSKFVDTENKLDNILNEIKTKLGIIQAEDRVAAAEASRAKTKEAIDALDSNSNMSIEEKNKKARELLFTYNGANLKAIENAKYISTMQESKFNENFGINFIDGVNQILKKLYDHIMTINLLPETKKTLIDNFNNISTFSNEYKAAISKQNANKRLYENAMKALGISKSKQVTKDVSNKQEKNIDPLEQEILEEKDVEKKDVEEKEIEPEVILSDIIKLKDSKKHQFKGNLSGLTPNKNYKVIDVVLHDGITHYKLEGMGNNLYNSMDFDEVEKEEELKHDDKLISNDNSVVEIPEEKSLEESVGIISDLNKPAVPGKKVIAQTERLGKGSIAARLIAVTYVTGAILVPAVGPIALIPGLAYAYKEYQSYKKHKENNNEKTIIQRQKSAIQDSFTFLKRKMTDKLFSKATTPEDKQELEEMYVVIDEQIKNDQETKKEENTFSEIVSTGDPVLDEVLEAAQTEMAEEGLSKEELFDKALENLTNAPITEEPKMGGR